MMPALELSASVFVVFGSLTEAQAKKLGGYGWSVYPQTAV